MWFVPGRGGKEERNGRRAALGAGCVRGHACPSCVPFALSKLKLGVGEAAAHMSRMKADVQEVLHGLKCK